MAGRPVKREAHSEQTEAGEREPAPRRVIHHRGDKTGVDRDTWLGPCRRGVMWRITHVGEYDPETDRTRIVYGPVSPTEINKVPGLPQRLAFIQQQQAMAAGAVSRIGGM